MEFYLIAADSVTDGSGSHFQTNSLLSKARKKGLRIKELEIVNLAKRWEDKLSPSQFKSGAAVMAALNKARKLVTDDKADLVLIKGQDFLKTGYERGEREKFMKLYRKKFTPLDGYNKLVPLFLKQHNISEKDYFIIRDALFDNYKRTFLKTHPESALPHEKWFEPLTKYFRGVDCANPNIDYSGQLVLSGKQMADELGIPKAQRISVLGNAFTKLSVDGFESLPKVATYAHLKQVFKKAQVESGVDVKKAIQSGVAALDVYTCYPVVPMGMLLASGLVQDSSKLMEFIRNHEVTVSGGLNLARAPWNLTSFNSIIEMRKRLINSKKLQYGIVHGNGSLGNQQGITILGKTSS